MTMAGGLYGLTLEKFFNNGMGGTWTNGMESETLLKTMLVQDAYTPAFDTHNFRDDVTNEPGNSGTYAAGGVVITTTELAVANPAATQMSFKAANPAAWTTATITAHGCVTYHTTGTNTTDELIVANAFAGDVSSSGGSFTLQFDGTNGLFYVDYA